MHHDRRLISTGLIASMLLVAAALAAAAREPVTLFGLTFPETVGAFQRGDSTDFEKNSPGLGHGVRYLRSGWTVNVFIYDLRMPSIPDDPLSDVVRRQFDQAKRDVF